ncbi:energy transducer TonB [Fulvivirga sp. 29W222]|uniref:Energy transducer TonB n=1 Tax=Fulvivirga marina TaxID=2494733 RepID=A0A937KG99_9BACT|nr:energy transducer TonB [Fulvivirga marina]MBL6449180.1 energy transducer TonB [Fulvivirga marina]
MDHMKVFFLAIFFFINLSLYGQQEAVQYLDKDFFPTEEESASYYKTYQNSEENGNQWIEKIYRVSGALYSEGRYENDMKQGAFIKYYANGAKWKEALFDQGIATTIKIWFRNGQIMEEGPVYDNEYRVTSSWDSLGNMLVQKGTGSYISYHENGMVNEKGELDGYLKQGQWEGFYENGAMYYIEEYKYGSLIEGKSWNEAEELFSYSTLHTSDDFMEKAEKFYSKIARKLRYPPTARRRGIQGKVYIMFFINENGKMCDAVVLKGIGYGCDTEVLRVFELISEELKFQPMLDRGQYSRTKIVLPITFKLG